MSADRKLIVWDWNGTVIADEDAAFRAFNATLLAKNKQPILMETWREAFEMPLHKFYSNAGIPAQELEEHIVSTTALFHESFEKFAANALLREGWKECVTVTGRRLFDNVVLSNHLVPSISYHAARLGIANEFEQILAHADQAEQLRKQSKGERLRLYMAKHDILGGKALIIGDTPEEAHIGKELGIASILMTGGYATQRRLEEAKPDYLIHSLKELPSILQQRGFAL